MNRAPQSDRIKGIAHSAVATRPRALKDHTRVMRVVAEQGADVSRSYLVNEQGPTARQRRFARWLILLCFLVPPASNVLAQDQRRATEREEKPAGGDPKATRLEERILDQLIAHVAASTRVLQVGESASERISEPPAVAPGAPPLLSFRYFDGKQRHRFGNLDLVMDDAGH
jgi:hypothetical protein